MSKAINKAIKLSTFGMVDLEPDKPKQSKVRTAPDPEKEAVAKSRDLQRRRRTGRTSTVLNDGSNTLG